MNLDHYLHQEIYVKVDQIVYPNNRLRDIDEAHCHALAKSVSNYKYGYTVGTRTVYFSSSGNQEGATYMTAVRNVDGMKVLKVDCCTSILDGRLERCCAELLRNKYGVEWAAKPLRMHCTSQVDGGSISPALKV